MHFNPTQASPNQLALRDRSASPFSLVGRDNDEIEIFQIGTPEAADRRAAGELPVMELRPTSADKGLSFPNSISTALFARLHSPRSPTPPPGSWRSRCVGTHKLNWLYFLWLPLSRRGQSSLHELGSRAQPLSRRQRDGSLEMATASFSNPAVIPGPLP